MATKKQAETQKAKEQADEALKKLTSAIVSVVEYKRLLKQYNELKQDYLELALSIQQSASNSARVMSRHHINRGTTFSFGEGQKNNG
jgi:uncharacterized protein YjcR